MQHSQDRRPTIFWATAGAAVLMIVGGFAPWATFLGLSIDGTHGDGWFLIIGGILAAGLLFWHASSPRMWKAILIAVVALIGLVVAAIDLSNISGFAGESGGLVQTGWGLYVSLLASIALLAAALYTIVKRPYTAQATGGAAETQTGRNGTGGAPTEGFDPADVRAAEPHEAPRP